MFAKESQGDSSRVGVASGWAVGRVYVCAVCCMVFMSVQMIAVMDASTLASAPIRPRGHATKSMDYSNKWTKKSIVIARVVGWWTTYTNAKSSLFEIGNTKHSPKHTNTLNVVVYIVGTIYSMSHVAMRLRPTLQSCATNVNASEYAAAAAGKLVCSCALSSTSGVWRAQAFVVYYVGFYVPCVYYVYVRSMVHIWCVHIRAYAN